MGHISPLLRLGLTFVAGLTMLLLGASLQPVGGLNPLASMARAAAPPSASPQPTNSALRAYGQLPMSFIPNAGQMDAAVRYYAQGGGHGFAFTSRGARLSFQSQKRGELLELNFINAALNPSLHAQQRASGTVNYLIGNDPSRWRTGLPTYGQVAYRDLWPGIDLAFGSGGGRLTYELTLQPGARVTDVGFAYDGSEGLSLDRDGNLLVRTGLGTLIDERPMTYQVIEGKRVSVASRFVLPGGSHYGFAVGAYDARQPLVIDPGLTYSTFLGGSGTDEATGIAIDSTGSAYVAGFTTSTNFPTTPGAFQPTYNGGTEDGFITKLNSTGSALVYSTYLGGSGADTINAIAVDTSGSAYVTGFTQSANFPTTPGAFQTTPTTNVVAFVTKLNPTGSAPLYSTRLGGTGGEQGFGITVDAAGDAFVTGFTGSLNFPTTPGAFDTSYNQGGDAFVTKLNPLGTAPLLYSTYLGGSGLDQGLAITIDATGSAYVTGSTGSMNFPTTAGAFDTTFNGGFDVFVTKLNTAGSAPLVYSTYLGGSGTEFGRGIALDSSLNAYVTGSTDSSSFPTTLGASDTSYNGGTDAFITKVNPLGTAPLVYSTFLGGSSYDEGRGIAVDLSGDAYVTGYTLSTNFPTTPGAYNTSSNGSYDVFLTKANPLGSGLLYSTYLGGSSLDIGLAIIIDATGSAYLAGFTGSSNYPTTPGAFDTSYNGAGDTFVTKLLAVGAPASLVLTPPAATNQVGTPHTVTATVRDAALQPVPGVTVRFTVAGANPTSGSDVTNASGQATFTYTGTVAGLDTITAYADTNNNNTQDTGEPNGVATKIWTPGPPATLTLTPPTATNVVGAQHCVTATVRDVYGNPVPNVTVVFSVPTAVATHASPATGSATTNSSGQAQFCYTASLPGADLIHAFADTNHNGVQDLTTVPPEPFGDATKLWIPPTSSGTCKITNAGWITAINGDRGNFSGEVHVANGQATGHESYEDRGPLEPQQIDSTSLLAAICPSAPGPQMAMIYGHATVDGAGDFVFLITVTDGGNGGKNDSYGIIVSNGYISGQQPLQGGNVNIR